MFMLILSFVLILSGFSPDYECPNNGFGKRFFNLHNFYQKIEYSFDLMPS